jgi:AraC family transcriptional regulator of adaptative response / DNA-3-methyladenine glycosylase II
MPRSRARALTGLATALASGELSLDPGAERDRAEAILLALPGIGPWTASYIRMRALSDPDAFLPSDVGVLDALTRLAERPAPAEPRARARVDRTQAARIAAELGGKWRPWRSYAVHHLWASLEGAKKSS